MLTTMELYDALVSVGVEDQKAKAAAQAVLSREEAPQMLATKQDLASVRDELHRQTMWMAGLLIGQTAILTGIMTLMFNIYG